MEVLESVTTGTGENPNAPPPAASVLVIDDEASVRKTLSTMLQADGYAVVTVGSGKEAVAQSRRQHFDLAITDLVMPEMDGIQTMAALKAADPDMEVMVLTGHGGVDSAVHALRQGACDYLLKPFTMTQLGTAVEGALERRKRNTPLPLRPAPTSFTQKVKGLGRIRDKEAWGYTLALALAVVMTGSFLHFHIGRMYQEETAQWQARQSSIAEDRAQRVSDWLTERQADAELISSHPAVLAALQAHHDAGQLPRLPAGAPAELTAAFDEMARVYYYNGVYLLDTDAHLVAQSQYAEPLSPRFADISRTVAHTGALRSEVLSDALGKTLVSFSAPVFSQQGITAGGPSAGQPRGAVVLVVDASQTLFPLVTHESIPTRTGEALLVRREGDDIVFFSPLRRHPAGSPNLRFPLSTAPLAARAALEGHETFMEFKDYRGVPVLAATRYIQSAGWGLVNKIDRTEAYENVHHMAVEEGLAAGLLIILLGGLLAYHRRTTLMRALKQKEGEFRALLESAPDATAITDGEGRIVLLNAQAEILFGYERQELIGRPLGIVFPEWAPERSGESGPYDFSKVVARHVGKTFEMHGLRKGGVEFPSEVRLSPVKEIEGGLFSCGIRDITERKRAEANMAERHRLATLVAEVGVALTGAETLRRGLQRCAEILVRDIDAAFARVWSVNDGEKVLELEASAGMYTHLDGGHARVPIGKFKIGRIAESGEPHLTNTVREDSWVGDPEWARREGMVAFAGYPLKVDEQVLGVVAVFARKPLTEATLQTFASVADSLAQFIKRKRAEQALAHERDLLRALMDNLPDYIYFTDSESRFLRINRAHAQALGLSDPAQAVGKTDFDFFPFEDAENYYEDEKQILQTGQPHTDRVESVRKADGQLLWCSATKVPIRDDQGRVTGLVGITRDITEQKRAEEALRDSEEKFRVLYESSHDAIMMLAPPEWKFTAGNPAAIALFGASDEREFVATAPWRLSPEYQPDGELSSVKAPQMIDAAMETGSHFFEWTHKKFNGEVFFATVALTRMIYRGQPILQATVRNITERKRAEHQAHLLTTALESAANGIMIANRDGCIIWVNPAFTRLSGYSAAEVVGQNPRIWKSGAQGKEFYQQLWKTVLAGEVWQGEIVNRRKDGTEVTEGMTITPVRDALGTISHFIAIKEDITGRKRAEAALQESEQRYRLLFSQMLVGFALLEIITDEKGVPVDHRFLEVNSAFETHAGLRRCAVLGRTIREALPGIEPFWIETYGKVGTTGESIHFENYAQPLQRWFEVTAFRLRPGQVAVTFADITQRKRAEEEMRASEARYRELFENASDIVYTTDLDTHLTSLNRAGQKVLGYSEEEATQLSLWQVVAPKHWELVRRGRERLLAGEKDATSVVEVTAKDGRQMVIEANPRLIYKDGKPVGVQAIARDITGRDVAEMELRHAQKLESVGRLASGIAHEINTPIQFVGDNTRFLQESFESFQSLLGKYQELCSTLVSGAASPEFLAEVQRLEEATDCAFLLEEVPRAITETLEGVERVATIVRAMKEFAHPESKEMAAADLNKALLSTLTVARNELKYVADVETEFGELPMVVCNVGDLNQVFLNLLVNAAHAIGDVVKGTSAKGKIHVRTQADGSTVLVTISDTGCGIPEANRPKVFDPFFTTKEVGRGTGQGLAIARTVVVERHKGALTFESEVGKGTTFSVRLPIDPGECSRETRTP